MPATAATPRDLKEQGAAPGERLNYRPHLDGLRAFAVYLVVAFHAGLAGFQGGFIGVDVFFVLSGFLVTRLMLGDRAGGGGIEFARFYARRARRLLPAAMLTLTAIVAAWSVLVTRAELQPVLESTRSAFLYVANWHFIAETSGYFATDVDSNPVLHFWSLSIEEQFYVGWPVVLTAILAVARRFTSRPEQAARLIVIGLAIASALWARHLASIDVSRSYYGTDARAYQLLAGAAIALSPELTLRMRARWGRTASSIPIGMLVGLIVLATSAVNVDVVNRGFLVTAVTVALLVALETTQGGVGRRVLASSPAVALGRISYGTYLWHWPVIVIARMETNMSPAAIAVAGAIIATTLAALSARLLELPIRRSTQLNGRHRAVIAASLATSAIAGLVVLPMLARSTDQPTVVASASGGDLELDWQAAKDDRAQRGQCPEDHLKDHLTECHLHEGSGDRVLILGDSQTWSFTPALTDLAASEDWDLWALSRGGCNWERNLIQEPPLPRDHHEECFAAAERWYGDYVPEINPDVVILVRTEGENPVMKARIRTTDGPWLDWDTPDYWRTIEDAAETTVADLTAEGARVLIVEPWPITSLFATDPTQCLSGALTVADVDECAYAGTPGGPSHLERIYRELADSDPAVETLDLDPRLCPGGARCPAVIDGVIVRRDWSHLTATFVRAQNDLILAHLDEPRNQVTNGSGK